MHDSLHMFQKRETIYKLGSRCLSLFLSMLRHSIPWFLHKYISERLIVYDITLLTSYTAVKRRTQLRMNCLLLVICASCLGRWVPDALILGKCLHLFINLSKKKIEQIFFKVGVNPEILKNKGCPNFCTLTIMYVKDHTFLKMEMSNRIFFWHRNLHF